MRNGLSYFVLCVSAGALLASGIAIYKVNTASDGVIETGTDTQGLENRIAALESQGPATVQRPAIRVDEAGNPAGFVELTKSLAPAVVNISTSQTVEIDLGKNAFPEDSPLERFNDFFGGGGEENRVSKSQGWIG